MSCILTGCSHPEEVERLLPGIWEGSSASHTWCASYSENHALHVQIKILPKYRTETKVALETPVVSSMGRWDLEHGPRLFNTVLDSKNAQENIDTASSPVTSAEALLNIAPFESPNFVTSSYIIVSIDQNKMEYVDMNDRAKKYVSERVESCSEIFSN